MAGKHWMSLQKMTMVVIVITMQKMNNCVLNKRCLQVK